MSHLSKYRLEFLLLVVLIGTYFLIRLPHLTLQPIFADEAIYIRWAQIMKAEPTLRFVSLSDGKTPLYMWLMIPMFKFIHDPLLAGRFLSVLSGSLTLLGVYSLGRLAFNVKTALWAALFYSILPYTVFFDRMALVDSLLAAFTVWGVYFSIIVAKTLRFDAASILGYALGGGLLVKTPAMVNIMMLPISILAFKVDLKKRELLYRLFFNWIVAIGIAMLIYNILRLGPGFEQLSARNTDYMFSPLDLVSRPLDPFLPHFNDISDWFPKLFGWPILLLVLAGSVWTVVKRNRVGLILLVWALVPMMIYMALLKTFTARYLLSSVPLFLILAGYALTRLLENFKKRYLLAVILSLILFGAWPVYFDYLLSTNPSRAPLPQEERRGYLEEWTAGYGLKQIAAFLIDRSLSHSVVVGTEGFFGTLPDGLQIYLNHSKITVLGSPATISAQLKQAARDNETYFVINQNRLTGTLPKSTLIMKFDKARPEKGNQDAMLLYRVIP